MPCKSSKWVSIIISLCLFAASAPLYPVAPPGARDLYREMPVNGEILQFNGGAGVWIVGNFEGGKSTLALFMCNADPRWKTVSCGAAHIRLEYNDSGIRIMGGRKNGNDVIFSRLLGTQRVSLSAQKEVRLRWIISLDDTHQTMFENIMDSGCSIADAGITLIDVKEHDAGREWETILHKVNTAVEQSLSTERGDTRELKADIDEGIELYVFDFEETLARTKSAIEQKMLDQILARLAAGKKVAIITGVNVPFLHSNFGVLIPRALRAGYRTQLFYMAELGAQVGRYDEYGDVYIDEQRSRRLSKEKKHSVAVRFLYPALARLGLLHVPGIETRVSVPGNEGEYVPGESIEIGLEKYGTLVVRFWDPSLRRHMADIVREIREPLMREGFFVAASNAAIDISPLDKGMALELLRAIIREDNGEDIPLERIAVFGDSQNDYAMLGFPGVGKKVYVGDTAREDLPARVTGGTCYYLHCMGPRGTYGVLAAGSLGLLPATHEQQFRDIRAPGQAI
jgi:hypothetical protein